MKIPAIIATIVNPKINFVVVDQDGDLIDSCESISIYRVKFFSLILSPQIADDPVSFYWRKKDNPIKIANKDPAMIPILFKSLIT